MSQTSAGLVSLEAPGYPVLRDGWSANGVEVRADSLPRFGPGRGAVLWLPTGEAFYTPVVTLQLLNPSQGLYGVGFAGCTNPLPPTEGARLFPALTFSLAYANGQLSFTSASGTQARATLANFALRYVYSSGGGNEVVRSDYPGAAFTQGGTRYTLRALGVYAQGQSGAVQRDAARRVLLGGGLPPTDLKTCGGGHDAAAGAGGPGDVYPGGSAGRREGL